MRKMWIFVMAAVLALAGCADQEVFEQVQDVYAPQSQNPAQVMVTLPDDAAAPAMGSEENGELYFCDGYTLTVQTLAGGDLDRTLQAMTGFRSDGLTVLETTVSGLDRYECVWSSAGEGGDQVGRLLLLDDGAYHYVVTVMADAEAAGDLRDTWDAIFGSVSLGHTGS